MPEIKNIDLTSKNTPGFKEMTTNNRCQINEDCNKDQNLQNILKRFDVLRCDLEKYLKSNNNNVKQVGEKSRKFESSIINTNTNLSIDHPSSLKGQHISGL